MLAFLICSTADKLFKYFFHCKNICSLYMQFYSKKLCLVFSPSVLVVSHVMNVVNNSEARLFINLKLYKNAEQRMRNGTTQIYTKCKNPKINLSQYQLPHWRWLNRRYYCNFRYLVKQEQYQFYYMKTHFCARLISIGKYHFARKLHRLRYGRYPSCWIV